MKSLKQDSLDKLLKILVCPVCKRAVRVDEDRQKTRCTSCNQDYEIKDNIPIMLDDESKRELKSYLSASDGQHMVNEYDKKGLFLKMYNAARKISGGSNFHLPLKKRLDRVIRAGGERGVVLEIGSGNRRLHQKVVNVDIDLFENVDVVGDGAKLPFGDGTADAILVLAVLEHTKQPQKVVEECHRVLKGKGIIYAEVPFIFRYHSYPTDFWRFSLHGVEELFHKFSKEEVGICVGPSSGLLTFLTHYVSLFSFSNNVIINTLLKALTLCLLFPLKYLDLLLVKNQRAHELAAGVYFLGHKT